MAEVGERLHRVPIGAGAAHVPVDPVRVGPVCLDGHGGEPVLFNQPARHERALPVELVGAVRRFAEQDDAGRASR